MCRLIIARGAIVALLAVGGLPLATQARSQAAHCDIQGGASPDDVIGSCTKVITQNGDTGQQLAADLTIRGRAYRAKGDFDRAIADYSEAIRIDPGYALAVYSRGIAYFNKGDFDRSIADYSQALRLVPQDLITLQNRGHAYQAKQDYEHAIADYSEAIRVGPAFAPAYNDRCYARALAGRELEQAIADCNEALRLVPNDSHTLDSRGLTYLRHGELAHAIADYDAALRINPRQGASLYGRGLAKRKMGDNQAGDIDVAAAKNLAPNIEDEFARYGVK
jgi:tetratricopeptide (TPR) repeat protein